MSKIWKRVLPQNNSSAASLQPTKPSQTKERSMHSWVDGHLNSSWLHCPMERNDRIDIIQVTGHTCMPRPDVVFRPQKEKRMTFIFRNITRWYLPQPSSSLSSRQCLRPSHTWDTSSRQSRPDGQANWFSAHSSISNTTFNPIYRHEYEVECSGVSGVVVLISLHTTWSFDCAR